MRKLILPISVAISIIIGAVLAIMKYGRREKL